MNAHLFQGIATFASMPDDGFTTIGVVAAVTGRGVSSVWRAIKLDPSFPQPVRIGVRSTRWRVGDIRAWLAARAAHAATAPARVTTGPAAPTKPSAKGEAPAAATKATTDVRQAEA